MSGPRSADLETAARTRSPPAGAAITVRRCGLRGLGRLCAAWPGRAARRRWQHVRCIATEHRRRVASQRRQVQTGMARPGTVQAIDHRARTPGPKTPPAVPNGRSAREPARPRATPPRQRRVNLPALGSTGIWLLPETRRPGARPQPPCDLRRAATPPPSHPRNATARALPLHGARTSPAPAARRPSLPSSAHLPQPRPRAISGTESRQPLPTSFVAVVQPPTGRAARVPAGPPPAGRR